MRFVTLENTDLSLSQLALGTASLHHAFLRRERARLLQTAFDCGITHFDTSPYYGFGLAERDLGRFARGRRPSITIATKVCLYPPSESATRAFSVWARKGLGKLLPRQSALRWDWSPETARLSLDRSLARLGTEYVDLLLIHEPDASMIEAGEMLDWLEAERARGRVRYWGLAGEPERIEPFLLRGDRLAQVIQSRDSLSSRESDRLIPHGRHADVTYGYLSSRPGNLTVAGAISEALRRNRTGAVIFSATTPAHVAEIAAIAQ